ncbi:MAG: N-acetylglucosamine-6-phosphate deacetylase [Pyrinomonadaceae bacterium]
MSAMETNKLRSSNTARKLLLQNAEIVLPDKVLYDASILIKSGRISSVHPANEHPEGDADGILRLDGLRVFPGFIDVHIHGSVGVDTMTANKDDLERVSRFLAAQGVTAWLPTLVPAAMSDYSRAVGAIEALMQQQAREEVPQGARVLGVHYEGPFVNASQCGALHSAFFKTFSGVGDIETLPAPRASNAIKMMTLAPEVPGAINLTRELVDRGWIVAIGHTQAGLKELELAFSAGARHLTHFMNAMPPLHHRAPGPVGWGLTKKEVTLDLIADGVHVDPLVLQLLLQAKGTEGVTLISDAIAAAGMGDGDYKIWGETISVKGGRTSNGKGSIAGSVITMLHAMRMMRSLGVSEMQLAKMASTNPARLLRIDQLHGSIEVGKDADLVAIDEQGVVRLVMLAGHPLLMPAT